MTRCMWPNGGFVEPVDYRVQSHGFRKTSPFGLRTHPVTGAPTTMHYGIDLIGFSTIKSPVDGVVTFAGYNGGAGNEVRIKEHGTGDVFRLLHNRELWVRTGQLVGQGQGVAVMGTTGSSTGIHSHEETRPGGGAAIDPIVYYRRRNPATPSEVESKPLPTPTKRKKKQMSTGVIHTDVAADKDRLGAIVDTESGVFSAFGWFPVAYANNVAKGFGLEQSAPVTKAHYDALKRDMAAKAVRDGKVFVDIADEDVPKIGA